MKSVDKLYALVLIISSGFGISVYRSFEGFIALAIFTALVFIIKQISFDRRFVVATLIWLFYCLLVSLTTRLVSFGFTTKIILYMAITYIIAVKYGPNFINYYIKVIYVLCLTSLAFWLWHMVNPGSLHNFMNAFGFDTYIGREFETANLIYKNVIVYTYTNLYEGDSIIPRNYGFCWEPGPFSVFILIAVLFHEFRSPKGFKFLKDKKFLVFTLTLLSTQSTTGYVGLFSLLLYFYISSRHVNVPKLLFIPVFLSLLTFSYFYFPVFSEKINVQIASGEEIESTINKSKKTGMAYSAGRFGGMIIAWNDFKKRPLFGLGDDIESSFGSKGGSQVYIVNGLASVLSVYGLFGLIILLVSLRRSSIRFNILYGKNLPYAFLIILIIAYFSFSFHQLALIFGFTFYSLFAKT